MGAFCPRQKPLSRHRLANSPTSSWDKNSTEALCTRSRRWLLDSCRSAVIPDGVAESPPPTVRRPPPAARRRCWFWTTCSANCSCSEPSSPAAAARRRRRRLLGCPEGGAAFEVVRGGSRFPIRDSACLRYRLQRECARSPTVFSRKAFMFVDNLEVHLNVETSVLSDTVRAIGRIRLG